MKTLLIFLLSFAIFFTTTSCEESGFMNEVVEATEVSDVADSAIDSESLEKTALDYTYTQTGFTGTIYLTDGTYNDIPTSVWDRGNVGTIFGKAVKYGDGSQYLTFWNTNAKRNKGKKSNRLFVINVTDNGSVELFSGGSNSSFVQTLSGSMNIHDKPLFEIVKFNIVSSD